MRRLDTEPAAPGADIADDLTFVGRLRKYKRRCLYYRVFVFQAVLRVMVALKERASERGGEHAGRPCVLEDIFDDLAVDVREPTAVATPDAVAVATERNVEGDRGIIGDAAGQR